MQNHQGAWCRTRLFFLEELYFQGYLAVAGKLTFSSDHWWKWLWSPGVTAGLFVMFWALLPSWDNNETISLLWWPLAAIILLLLCQPVVTSCHLHLPVMYHVASLPSSIIRIIFHATRHFGLNLALIWMTVILPSCCPFSFNNDVLNQILILQTSYFLASPEATCNISGWTNIETWKYNIETFLKLRDCPKPNPEQVLQLGCICGPQNNLHWITCRDFFPSLGPVELY